MSIEELSPNEGRNGLRHETCRRPFGVLLTQHRMLRISPTAKGRQVPCRNLTYSSARYSEMQSRLLIVGNGRNQLTVQL